MQYNIIDTKDSSFFMGKKVVVRLGINVPVSEGKIENDFRLHSVLPTIEFLSKSGAQVVLMGHIGREEKENLDLVFIWLKTELKKKKIHISYDKKTFVGLKEKKFKWKTLKKISSLKNEQVLLLDNIRSTKWESENNIELAQSIAKNFTIYINEAFPLSHREHMSVDILPAQFFEKNRFWGLQFQKEMDIAKKIKNPAGKSIFILGGSKTATKVPMLEKMIEKFDMVIIGGSVANDIYKEAGYEIGLSKIDSNFIFDKKLFEKIIKSKKVFMPKMVITKNGTKKITELSKEDNILDISPQSFESIEKKLKEADFVFFNGPMGYYEDGYDRGTKYLLKILANKNNFFVAGGGNTSSAIFEMGLESNVDFISTGGGALMKIISK